MEVLEKKLSNTKVTMKKCNILNDFQIRMKIFEMLPERASLELRRCCKQFKEEIDHLFGLPIQVLADHNSEIDCKNYEWIKHILIRKLTIQRRDGQLRVHSSWISFLTNGDFTNLNRLSLSGQIIEGEVDLVRILTALSTLNSLCELSLDSCVHYPKNRSISSETQTETVFNFPNLTALNFGCLVMQADFVGGEGITNLKSFQQILICNLKFFTIFRI